MPQNNYNVGSDVKLTLLSDGVPVRATILTGFEKKQETAKVKSTGIDGVVRNRHLESGWSGTFKYDRADSVLDDYFALKEQLRYAGFPPPVCTIMENITNASDGSVSKYRYDGVALTLSAGGSAEGDKKVEQVVDWDSSFRIKVQ